MTDEFLDILTTPQKHKEPKDISDLRREGFLDLAASRMGTYNWSILETQFSAIMENSKTNSEISFGLAALVRGLLNSIQWGDNEQPKDVAELLKKYPTKHKKSQKGK